MSSIQQGSDLQNYFTVAFSINATICRYEDRELKVLLLSRSKAPYSGEWSLPGYLVNPEMGPKQYLNQLLEGLVGSSDVYKRQLQTFSECGRHPAGRVISLVYYCLTNRFTKSIQLPDHGEDARWFNVEQLPELAFDHHKMVDTALKKIRSKVFYQPIVFELMPPLFTMPELQACYETLLKMCFDKRNFQKRMLALDVLIDTGQKQHTSNRPAKLYTFDRYKFTQQKARGKVFSIMSFKGLPTS